MANAFLRLIRATVTWWITFGNGQRSFERVGMENATAAPVGRLASAHIVWVTGGVSFRSAWHLFHICGMGMGGRITVLSLLETITREGNGRLSLYV
jgi:hypothetical protein